LPVTFLFIGLLFNIFKGLNSGILENPLFLLKSLMITRIGNFGKNILVKIFSVESVRYNRQHDLLLLSSSTETRKKRNRY